MGGIVPGCVKTQRKVASSSQLQMQGANSKMCSVCRCCLCLTGTYKCTFANRYRSLNLIYEGTKEIQVSPLRIISYSNDYKVHCNSPEIQANSPVLFCCIDGQLPLLTGDWKVNGAISITGEIYKRLPFTAGFACLSETSCCSAAASPEV